MNGEHYAGGTFLPSTTLAKMARRTKGSGTRKQMVAPFKWELVPAGKTSLFEQFRDFVDMRSGAVNEQACAYYGRDPKAIAFLYGLWVGGERWMLA